MWIEPINVCYSSGITNKKYKNTLYSMNNNNNYCFVGKNQREKEITRSGQIMKPPILWMTAQKYSNVVMSFNELFYVIDQSNYLVIQTLY